MCSRCLERAARRFSWPWALATAIAGGLTWVAIGYGALRAWVYLHG